MIDIYSNKINPTPSDYLNEKFTPKEREILNYLNSHITTFSPLDFSIVFEHTINLSDSCAIAPTIAIDILTNKELNMPSNCLALTLNMLLNITKDKQYRGNLANSPYLESETLFTVPEILKKYGLHFDYNTFTFNTEIQDYKNFINKNVLSSKTIQSKTDVSSCPVLKLSPTISATHCCSLIPLSNSTDPYLIDPPGTAFLYKDIKIEDLMFTYALHYTKVALAFNDIMNAVASSSSLLSEESKNLISSNYSQLNSIDDEKSFIFYNSTNIAVFENFVKQMSNSISSIFLDFCKSTLSYFSVLPSFPSKSNIFFFENHCLDRNNFLNKSGTLNFSAEDMVELISFTPCDDSSKLQKYFFSPSIGLFFKDKVPSNETEF